MSNVPNTLTKKVPRCLEWLTKARLQMIKRVYALRIIVCAEGGQRTLDARSDAGQGLGRDC